MYRVTLTTKPWLSWRSPSASRNKEKASTLPTCSTVSKVSRGYSSWQILEALEALPAFRDFRGLQECLAELLRNRKRLLLVIIHRLETIRMEGRPPLRAAMMRKRRDPLLHWMDLPCARHQPRPSAMEVLVLEPDRSLEPAPMRASWASRRFLAAVPPMARAARPRRRPRPRECRGCPRLEPVATRKSPNGK